MLNHRITDRGKLYLGIVILNVFPLPDRIYCQYDNTLPDKIQIYRLIQLRTEGFLVMTHYIKYCGNLPVNLVGNKQTTRNIKIWHRFIYNLLNPVAVFLQNTGNYRIKRRFFRERTNYLHKFILNQCLPLLPIALCS